MNRSLVVVLVFTACGSHPTPLQHDLAILCGQDMLRHRGAPNIWGPWLQPQMKSTEIHLLLTKLLDGRVAETQLRPQIDELRQTAGVHDCPGEAAIACDPTACPVATHCVMTVDGPGQVCKPDPSGTPAGVDVF